MTLDAPDYSDTPRDLQTAAATQNSMLPADNYVGSFFSAAALSVPHAATGGDFFDYVQLFSGDFGFIIGDVSGKGAAAALVGAAILGRFSAEAMHQASVGTVLARLNAALLERHAQMQFASAFYGVLSHDGSFTYSNGGHNPPVLLAAGGVRRLDVGGLLLGMFGEAVFPQETLTLRPGDAIAAFSDGITDAMNESGEVFTDARLIACLRKAASREPRAIVDAVMREVASFSGTAPQSDDMALVVVRYDGDARTLTSP